MPPLSRVCFDHQPLKAGDPDMESPSDMRANGTVIRFSPVFFTTPEPGLFDPDWLASNGVLTGQATGRGQAYFLSYSNHDMVLRHFRRGGLIGRFNRDRYLRMGFDRSRAFREFDLLAAMRSDGLPVPRPIAALYAPSGLVYKAALLTERIPNTQALHDVLCERPLPDHLWHTIGATVRQMHDQHVFHSDLNSRNILIDDKDKVWLIDFDKCDRRKPGPWMQGNLDRLQRSLRKSASQTPGLHWGQADWDALLAGYAKGRYGVSI